MMAKIGWNRLGYAVVALGALGLLSVGAWRAWPPAGLMVPGLLIWVDLSFMGRKRGRA